MSVALLVLSMTGLCYLMLNGLLSWLRTAWMLRKVKNGPKNMLYDGLVQMMASNRLRALQKMNEVAVNGSGVFYVNALWRQVCSVPKLIIGCQYSYGRLMSQVLCARKQIVFAPAGSGHH